MGGTYTLCTFTSTNSNLEVRPTSTLAGIHRARCAECVHANTSVNDFSTHYVMTETMQTMVCL